MLADAPLSVAPPSPAGLSARSATSTGCPRCDTPVDLGATLCGSCGATLGEPPRRSGMTQRALALDEGAAKAALERAALDKGARGAPPARETPAARGRTVRSAWDALFVVLTLGLGWLWLRRRERMLPA